MSHLKILCPHCGKPAPVRMDGSFYLHSNANKNEEYPGSGLPGSCPMSERKPVRPTILKRGTRVQYVRDSASGGESGQSYTVGQEGIVECFVRGQETPDGRDFYVVSPTGQTNRRNRTPPIEDVAPIQEPASKTPPKPGDRRFEAVAIALHSGSIDASNPTHPWHALTDRERAQYRAQAVLAVRAVDVAAEVLEASVLDDLPLDALLVFGDDVWHRHGYRWQKGDGVVRDSSDLLPALVIDWGTQ